MWSKHFMMFENSLNSLSSESHGKGTMLLLLTRRKCKQKTFFVKNVLCSIVRCVCHVFFLNCRNVCHLIHCFRKKKKRFGKPTLIANPVSRSKTLKVGVRLWLVPDTFRIISIFLYDNFHKKIFF